LLFEFHAARALLLRIERRAGGGARQDTHILMASPVDVTRFERSAIPEQCLTESTVMGIDEAGRGAVLGPMTYGCAFWSESVAREIEQMSFDDSKALTAEKRELMFSELKR
jgi:ribonuclease H2 subunit A